MIVSFKLYVMNFVNFVFDCYSHITSYVSQVFTSCTHYTSYSLLNFVYIIVCVFGLTNQVWKFLEFYAKHIWCLREWIENLNFRKTGSKTCVFEKHFISYSCMWFINFNALWSFCIILLCFSKNRFFQNFNLLKLFFDRSKLRLKMFVSLCLFRLVLDQSKHFRPIESIFRSIENRVEKFLKTDFHVFKLTFSKLFQLFLSLYTTRSRLQSNFLSFSTILFASFSLPRPVRPLYPSFCIYFQVSCIFLGKFQTYNF